MNIREVIAFLRAVPLRAKTDVADVPCIETSDESQLCQNPVVSVCMLAYNHASYIRSAIEGVMKQQANFDYELIIGEDASTDSTRDICFEYQKRFPDKIRVLWSDRNVNDGDGNSTRVLSRCRGEFIAFCEGDDWWSDPLKLQKQVDIFKGNSNVAICFSNVRILNEATGWIRSWNDGSDGFMPGLIPSQVFVAWMLFGKDPARAPGSEFFIMTASIVIRRSCAVLAMSKYEVFKWDLAVGDIVMWLGVGSLGDAYFLKDETAVYRRTSSGVTLSNEVAVNIDTLLVRYYYLEKLFKLSLTEVPSVSAATFFRYLTRRLMKTPVHDRLSFVCSAWRMKDVRWFVFQPRNWLILMALVLDATGGKVIDLMERFVFKFFTGHRVPESARRIYSY